MASSSIFDHASDRNTYVVSNNETQFDRYGY